ncbi:MAG: hypothetical protein QHH14_10235, partial [Clostridiales bacterium]|nr:hypothetical protein [Clostridiales bacterium]
MILSIFFNPLGLSSCFGPDAAVNMELRVAPREKAIRLFGPEKLLADKKPENLAGKKLSLAGFVKTGDLLEHPRLIHSALGHQEVGMRMTCEAFNYVK